MPPGTVDPSLLHQGSALDGPLGAGTTLVSETSASPNSHSSGGEGLGEFLNLSAMELDGPPANRNTTNPAAPPMSGNRPKTPPRPPSPCASNTRKKTLAFLMPAGRWLALPEIGMIHHVHDDGSPCTKPFEHACLASGFESGGFRAAYNDLADHFAGKARSRNDDLTDEIHYLRERLRCEREEHIAQMKALGFGVHNSFDPSLVRDPPTSSSTSSPIPSSTNNSASKRKSAELEQPEPEPAPPAKRPEITVPTIGFDTIDPDGRPSPYVDPLLVEFALHRPGYPLHRIEKLEWDLENGQLRNARHIKKHLRERTFPSPIAFTGNTSGAQMFPSSSAELQQIVTSSQTAGNFAALFRLRVMRSFATLLRYLHTKSPSSVPDVSGVALECLSVPITQPWAEIDNLVDYDGFHHADDSLSTWDASKTDIPSVLSSPSASDSLTKWAEAIAVHYIPSKHLGVPVTNDCHVWMPGVRGFFLYYTLAPLVPPTDKDSLPDYRTHFITLIANMGLYRDVVAQKHLEIASTRNITRCNPESVKSVASLSAHLAACGITVDEISSYAYFGMQYCIDACRTPSLPARTRAKYARIFISAQYRLLFFPLPLPADDTFFPSGWTKEPIIKYRRRCAVYRHWRDTRDSRWSSTQDVPKTTYHPQPIPDSTVSGVANMVIDSEPVAPGSQSAPGSN
ncbi:hypothetical protein AAF712_005693 [Marasmius tenuissimus]|uniref:Uncharacterized protein n=1 Tax=Marasmius tenuissimus TaxID=585030 RepID=A0ABR3A1A4_9AGAR